MQSGGVRQKALAAWHLASATILGFFWLIVLSVFWSKMAPRFGYILAHRPVGNDSPCPTPECDFSAFWSAGYMARLHELAQIYDLPVFVNWGQGFFFPRAYHAPFFYPPLLLLPSALVSWLPFEPAFFVWVGLLLGLSAWLLRRAGFSWAVTAFGLLCPAALWNVELGQLGLIGSALLLAGLMALRERPGAAGALLGLLAFKPQIGLLVPAAFAGRRSWRAAAGFAAVCLALVLLSVAVFGWRVWAVYLTAGRAETGAVLTAAVSGTWVQMGISVFWMLRSLGAGLALAYAVQAVAAAAAMLVAVWIWRQPGLPRLDAVALTVLLSLLAVPYGYADDMAAGSVALAALAERRGWRFGLLDVLFWLWPMLGPVVAARTGMVLTPVAVVLPLARCLWQAGLLRREAR